MPSLYTTLANDWHLLHPPRLAAVDFLQRCAGSPPSRIVDVAAASGEYAALLQRHGYEAYAVDVSHDMCEVARQRHRELAGVIHGDMLEIFDLVRGPLSLTYCIGGALCELANLGEVTDVVGQLLDLTSPAGCVVIEVPNFDHLREQARRLQTEVVDAPGEVRYGELEDSAHPAGSPDLGSISADEVRLYLAPVRRSREDGAEIRFEQQYVWTNATQELLLRWQFDAPEGDSAGESHLLELTKSTLATCLPPTAVSDWFGNWDGSPWSPASPHTIAVLRVKSG